MVNDILPPAPSPTSPVGPGDFRIGTAQEIMAWLGSLLNEQTRITLANASGASLVVRLCAVDAEHRALGFDLDRRDPQLSALLLDDEIQAVAYLDGIRLQFELEDAMLVDGADGGVLRCALPALLYRFQRRQAFRVRPNSRTAQVRLLHPQGTDPLRLRILNLSIGGLALLLPPELEPWPAGSTVAAMIELSADKHLPATLRAQHLLGADDAGAQLGFAFARIEAAAVRELQLYIDQTQKLSRLLRKS